MEWNGKVVGIVGAIFIVAGAAFAFRLSDNEDAKLLPQGILQAQSTMRQAVDLTQITAFRYVNDLVIPLGILISRCHLRRCH